MLKISFCLLLLVVIFYGVQGRRRNSTRKNGLSKGYFEGDMILSPELKEVLEVDDSKSSSRRPRHALLNPVQRWPSKTVVYEISRQFSSQEQEMIREAMNHISEKTCVRFQRRGNQRSNYIMVKPSDGCSATVGFVPGRVTEVNLQRMQGESFRRINGVLYKQTDRGCFDLGIVVHELGHTLGLFHQQSSTDRDRYVRILHQNIRPGFESEFKKMSPAMATSFGIGYDYYSIMHYRLDTFSRQRNLPTIEPLRRVDRSRIGNGSGLSKKDIMKIAQMYDC